MTPRARIAAGIGLIVAGVLVGLAFRLQGGFINLYGAVAAWALTIGGLVVLLFRQSEAPIATGAAMVLVAPFLWFQSVLTPVTVFFVLSFVPAFAVATYGFAIIALERAAKRREEVS